MKKKKLKHQTEPSPAGELQGNDMKALREEIVRLQSQLKHEQMRAEAYDEMINAAESKFKISIRKKLVPNGSKPARKESESIL
ncbi:MAG: hypothetical protein LBP64_05475 [Tannerella sp.]|jgi:hypothetical protein|nr:hypothetical protein [Tannerella sp.]